MGLTKYNLKPLILWILLLLVVIWSTFPVCYAVISSFKMPKDIYRYPPTFIPRIFTFKNFVDLFNNWTVFPQAMFNSLVISLGSIVLTVIISMFAAFSFSRFSSRFLKGSAFFIIAIRMFPPIIISIPLYPILSRLNLADSHLVLIVLYTVFQVTVMTWIFKVFFDNIPKEIEEAAVIDGCSPFESFYKIIIPLARPSIVTVSLLVGIYAWNEYMFAFLFVSTNAKTTPLLISEMMGSLTGIAWGQVFAANFIQMVPVLIFVLLVQRFLVKGVMTGAFKG